VRQQRATVDAQAGCVPFGTSTECGTDDGTGCAPESSRVDLCKPSFSNPTNVTNPLNPISELHSVVLLGSVDGAPLRVEVTLLPGIKTIVWDGRQIATLESQYVAFLDGRIEEVAIDWYAQDDDGAVWYFGEDVFNYEDGVVADTEGTWIAGSQFPPGMITPGDPKVGDVYRPENIPGLVFEEVTVSSTNVTVSGPSGSVNGAIVVDELHMDSTHEDKTFAPGYGEFSTGSGANLEAVALAVPVDALPGAPPVELETLLDGANDIFDAAQSDDWNAASTALDAMTTAWNNYRAGDVPEMLEAQMTDAFDALNQAVGAQDPAEASQAAIYVALASLDFHLRHLPPAEIDLARLEVWTARVIVDAEDADSGAVKGDVTTLEWVRDRIAHSLAPAEISQINALLDDLRAAADADDFAAAITAAEELRAVIAEI